MRRLTGCLIAAVGLLAAWQSAAASEPLRGIELHPDTPDAVVKAFAKSGINTVVLSFRRQGNLADPAFVKSLSRWGKLAKQYKLRCLLAVRLFGPRDYVGYEGGFTRAIEAIATTRTCVSPGDPDYWAKVVRPRVRKVAELAKQHGLAGGLFDYQATLTAVEYNATFCFCDVCWHAFVKAKHGGDEKLMKMPPRARINWVRSSSKGGDYYAFLSQRVQAEMTKTLQAARAVLPDVVLGTYGWWDTWFYRGIARASAGGQKRQPAVLGELERTSIGRLRPLLEPSWRKAGLGFEPVARLPLDYYLPNDVQNQIAELDRDEAGFLLTCTDSLWRRKVDIHRVFPPHGTPAAFATAVRDGLKGEHTGQPILFNEAHFAQYLPRVGLVQGKGLSAVLSGLIKPLAQRFQLPVSQLDAAHAKQWAGLLSFCKALIILPGAAMTNEKDLAAAAPAFERFVRNGGILFVLNAASKGGMTWLSRQNPRFACEGERPSGMKPGWLDNEGGGLLSTPVHVEKCLPQGVRFASFDKAYAPVAKDSEGKAYLLAQEFGRGMLIASAGPIIPFELLANAFFRLNVRGDVFNVTLLPGADTVTFGDNKLLLGVAELPETAGKVNVLVDAIDDNGKRTSHQFFDVSVAGDGLRIPLRYVADKEGVGRVVVSITDPVDGALLQRRLIRVLHDQAVEILPDKNYYTTEPSAVVRLRYFDPALRKASVHAKLAGKALTPKLTGEDPRFAAVPIAELPCGTHKLEVAFLQDGKSAYSGTVTIRKEPPFPTAVKMLYHRSCALEVDGKPFFPFGCYGGQDTDIHELGVNTTRSGGPGKAGKLRYATGGLTGWAASDEWTPEKVRETLRGEKYKMLLSWYNYDEPLLHNRTPEFMRAIHDAGQAKDPYHPQMVVYVGSAAYPQYPETMHAAECQMIDHYPLPFFSRATYGEFLRKVTDAARGRRNVWGVPQCFDWRELGSSFGPYRKETLHPRGPEALNYAYQSIIEGAGAITYWTFHYMEEDPSRYAPFRKALAEGAKIAKLVAQGAVVQSPRVQPLCAQVRCRSFQIGKEIYIVAANYLNRRAEVTFDAPYLEGKPLRVHLPAPRQLGGLSDTFEPLEGKVYVVGSP